MFLHTADYSLHVDFRVQTLLIPEILMTSVFVSTTGISGGIHIIMVYKLEADRFSHFSTPSRRMKKQQAATSKRSFCH